MKALLDLVLMIIVEFVMMTLQLIVELIVMEFGVVMQLLITVDIV